MPEYLESLGIRFFELTKHTRKELFERKREAISPSTPFKEYQGAKVVELPEPLLSKEDIWNCLSKRRSVRKYKERPITPLELSGLLWASQGITARLSHYLLRTAPSAGALYPIETYLLVNSCDGIESGIYHYHVVFGHLEEIKTGPFGKELGEASLGQPMCWQAPVVFIFSAVFRRTMSKYGSRGMRYVFLDCGHICQNLLLAATALGLGGCPIGAFLDDEVNVLLGLDGVEESVIYMASIGEPK